MRTRKSGKIIEFKEEKDLHFEAKAKTQRLSMSVLMIFFGVGREDFYMIEIEREMEGTIFVVGV